MMVLIFNPNKRGYWMSKKAWYRSKTIWTAILYGLCNVLRAFGINIPDSLPEAVLAMMIIFLRLGNGTSIKNNSI